MTANDNNDVALLAEVFRFLLPRPRRITYCIKNSGVCIGFFEKLRTFFPFCHLKCGLCNCKKGFLRVRGALPGLQLVQIGKNEHLSASVPHDALDLRVGLIARHQQHGTLFFGLCGNALDLLHKGAGGIVVRDAAHLQLVVHAAGHPVAADDHLIAIRHLRHAVGHKGPLCLHVGHSLRVVDQRAEGGHPAPAGRRSAPRHGSRQSRTPQSLQL